MIIDTPSIEQARKQILNSKNKLLIVEAQDEKFNRKILEYGKFNILLSPEKNTGKEKIKTLNSGLNHVLAKIATKNNISIGINLKDLSKLSKLEKAKRLAKIKQNIKICKKAKTHLALTPQNKHSQKLLLTLGASTDQVKKSLSQPF